MFRQFLSPIQEGVMLAPWNLYPARNVDTNSHIETECFNLLNRGDVIPQGFTLLNSALRTPCGGFHRAGIVHHESGGFTQRAPLNRVPSGCSTGMEYLGLFHWGSMLHPLCAMLCALCAMLALPLGVQLFFKKVSHKAPSTHNEGGAFLFCLPHEAGP